MAITKSRNKLINLERILGVISLIIAIVSLYYAIHYSKLSTEFSEQARKESLILQSPTLYYEFQSNYAFCAFHTEIPISERLQNLKSSFEIRNISGNDLQDFSFHLYLSLDSNSIIFPYKFDHVYYHVFPSWKGNFPRDSLLHFDIIEALKKWQFPLICLFPEGKVEKGKLMSFMKLYAGSFSSDQSFAQNNLGRETSPFIDAANYYVEVGTYYKGIIHFLFRGTSYRYVLTGALACAYPKLHIKSREIMVLDYLVKQPHTEIISPTFKEYLPVPQSVYLVSQKLSGYNYPEETIAGINVTAPTGTHFVFKLRYILNQGWK